MSDSSDAENEVIEKTLKNVEFIQTMIDSTAKLLLGLRNECAATNDLTQNEIREQEVSNKSDSKLSRQSCSTVNYKKLCCFGVWMHK